MRSARALVLTLAVAALPARAEGPHELRHDLRASAIIIGSASAISIGNLIFQDDLAPERCRFCGTNALDAWTRRKLVMADEQPARLTSDALTFLALPAAVAAHQLLAGRVGNDLTAGAQDLLFITEAVTSALALTQAVKLAVGRQRPFVRYGNYEEPDRRPETDDNLSFFSGHAALAFSMASAAGTVSSLRGYRSAPWVWGASMALAAGVAYFRVAADKHYLTDVVTGAVIGTAIGVAAPRLLHPREREGDAAAAERVTFVPLPIGVRVAF